MEPVNPMDSVTHATTVLVEGTQKVTSAVFQSSNEKINNFESYSCISYIVCSGHLVDFVKLLISLSMLLSCM